MGEKENVTEPLLDRNDSSVGPASPRVAETSTESPSSCTNGALSSYIPNGKQIVGFCMTTGFFLLFWDATMRSPEDRWLKPEASAKFLEWVEAHPSLGMGAFLIVIAVCVVTMVPVGTPLTLGCGYIYKGVYGWGPGVALATLVSMAGSALGAVMCFLLGRYMMRDRARKWIRKYPLFDAIDVAAAEHGFRIMAMLYLTPILPLGPVSYMCGSTSMTLSNFVLAKVASLPLMTLYVFIGASAGTLIADTEAIESNSTLIVSGILLSMVMIVGISHFIRKELMRILDQKKGAKEEVGLIINSISADDLSDVEGVELGGVGGGGGGVTGGARQRTRVS